MSGRVLHILSQRPSLTGSGVTLEATIRLAAAAGWEQSVIVGTVAADPHPTVDGLPHQRVHSLVFERDGLDFPLPGMSDVMPYPSSVFSTLTPDQLQSYREAWRQHITIVAEDFQPDLVQSHHVWIVSSLLKDILPDTPVATHCHATGLRQMSLCPHLADEVKRGCARNERFLALSAGQADLLVLTLEVPLQKIHITGSGYRAELFQGAESRQDRGETLLYIGKYSEAKGLPWLLDACERLQRHRAGLVLHVAGSGAGSEAEGLRRRMQALAPAVVMHGQLPQPALANLMRRCAVCVLPSFYEGLPLVLVEALACGCRLVATRLPGIDEQLAPSLGDFLDLVPLPRLVGVDQPRREELPAFVECLEATLSTALDKPPPGEQAEDLRRALVPFTWNAVWERVAAVWSELCEPQQGHIVR